jgi:hypothetical protein
MRHIGLAALLSLGVALTSLAGEAQSTEKVARVRILGLGPVPSPQDLAKSVSTNPFWMSMKQLGWVDGENMVVERRFGDLGMKKNHDQGVVVMSPAFMFVHRKAVIDLAATHRIPAIYELQVFVEPGGLMSYGVNVSEMQRRAAVYADRILKGATPADLPVEQPTKFELVINMKTAKALGLTVPQSLLVRADEIIQ